MTTDYVFQAELRMLPPSVNEMYVYTSRGPRPSAKMKRFRAKASVEIARQIPFSGSPLDKNKGYRLNVHYYLPSLYNKGWPRKAKTKYKRRDVSNLVKVLEDVVADCLGIDDSCFVEEFIKKHHGPDECFVGIRVSIQEMPDEPQNRTQ